LALYWVKEIQHIMKQCHSRACRNSLKVFVMVNSLKVTYNLLPGLKVHNKFDFRNKSNLVIVSGEFISSVTWYLFVV